MDGPTLTKIFTIGFALIIAGILVIIVGTLIIALKSPGETEYGGVVTIGPIPIVFGSSSEAVKTAVIGAIILMVLALVIMLLPSVLTKYTAPGPG